MSTQVAVPPVADHLRALMDESLVQVRGAKLGSGFFIAPRVVVTCAHVAGPVRGRVMVRWRDTQWEGVVRWASPLPSRGRPAPYPDLAVVTVAAMTERHPCVWLDDHLPSVPTQFVVTGHAELAGMGVSHTSGLFSYGGGYADMIRLIGDEVAAGMSGAPVLNVDTGGVCAITKMTRMPDQPAGGLAVPVRGLRAIMNQREYRELRKSHDDYHRRNRRWTDLSDTLEATRDGIPDRAERELRSLFGRLPEAKPADLLAGYHAVAGPWARAPKHQPFDHGDVVTELADLVPPGTGFPHVLAYAIELARDLADHPVAEQLRMWARLIRLPRPVSDEVAARLAAPPRDRDRRQGMASVLVCVRPGGPGGTQYRYRIWRYVDDGDIAPVVTDGPAVPLDELRARLRNRLPDLAGVGPDGRPPTMIELVVPPELLDEEVDHWPSGTGQDPAAPFGQTHPVVVRDLHRFEDEGTNSRYWRERWDALDGQDIGMALHRVHCVEDQDPGALQGLLDVSGSLGTLVLPCSPRQETGRAALRIALDSGVPIMMWRRDGCTGAPEIGHDDCPGGQLARTVQTELSDARRYDVPERVRMLRHKAAAHAEPECGRDVVLLWDDPGRRLPRRPLVTPDEGRAAGG